MIFLAQGSSSFAEAGRQMKIFSRLGVSLTPVALNGPLTPKSRTWGREVRPATEPAEISPRVRPIGRRRSSYGPSVLFWFFKNAAEIRCGPAFTLIKGVLRT